MSFEIERIDRHSFVFDEEEIEYRKEQWRQKSNSEAFSLGFKFSSGIVWKLTTEVEFKRQHLWRVFIDQPDVDDPGELRITTEDMAVRDKVDFYRQVEFCKENELWERIIRQIR